MVGIGYIECDRIMDFQIEMLNKFQNRKLELELGVRMKALAFLSRETTSLSSQPHIDSFLIRINNMKVQDRPMLKHV